MLEKMQLSFKEAVEKPPVVKEPKAIKVSKAEPSAQLEHQKPSETFSSKKKTKKTGDKKKTDDALIAKLEFQLNNLDFPGLDENKNQNQVCYCILENFNVN